MDQEALMKSIRALLPDIRTKKEELCKILVENPSSVFDSLDLFTFEMRDDAQKIIDHCDQLMRYWLDDMDSRGSIERDAERYRTGQFSLSDDDEDLIPEPPSTYADDPIEQGYKLHLNRSPAETIKRLDKNKRELVKILMSLRDKT